MFEKIRYSLNLSLFLIGQCYLNDAFYKEEKPETALRRAHLANVFIKRGAESCLKLVEHGYETEEWEPKELERSLAVSSLYVKKMEGNIGEEEFNTGLEQNSGLLSRFMSEPYIS